MYQEQFADLDNRPYHLFFTARLVDVPMLTDIVGVVPEARQRLELVDCRVLASDIHVPQGFVNRATPTIVPYTFVPGPKAGYYLVKMSGEARFVPQRREEEEMPMPEEEVDFGPDDFEEVTEPTLSTFDVDVESAAQPATSRTATTFGALEKLQKMRKKGTGRPSQTSTSMAGPSTSASGVTFAVSSATTQAQSGMLSAKKRCKQAAVARSGTQQAPQQQAQPQLQEPVQQLQPSMSTGTEQTGTTTTELTATEPDYLGLLEVEESASAVSPTFSSRLAQMAGSTSAVVDVAATGEMEVEEQLGEEEIEVGEGSELKRRRTRDTQSTGASMQDVKRSKTIAFLKGLQEKAKKK